MSNEVTRTIKYGGLIEVFQIDNIINNSKNTTLTVKYDRGQFSITTSDKNGMWGETTIRLNSKELFALKDILNSDEFNPLEAGIKSVR